MIRQRSPLGLYQASASSGEDLNIHKAVLVRAAHLALADAGAVAKQAAGEEKENSPSPSSCRSPASPYGGDMTDWTPLRERAKQRQSKQTRPTEGSASPAAAVAPNTEQAAPAAAAEQASPAAAEAPPTAHKAAVKPSQPAPSLKPAVPQQKGASSARKPADKPAAAASPAARTPSSTSRQPARPKRESLATPASSKARSRPASAAPPSASRAAAVTPPPAALQQDAPPRKAPASALALRTPGAQGGRRGALTALSPCASLGRVLKSSARPADPCSLFSELTAAELATAAALQRQGMGVQPVQKLGAVGEALGCEVARLKLQQLARLPPCMVPGVVAKSVLLYGPPGCGKSLMASALASSLLDGEPAGRLLSLDGNLLGAMQPREAADAIHVAFKLACQAPLAVLLLDNLSCLLANQPAKAELLVQLSKLSTAVSSGSDHSSKVLILSCANQPFQVDAEVAGCFTGAVQLTAAADEAAREELLARYAGRTALTTEQMDSLVEASAGLSFLWMQLLLAGQAATGYTELLAALSDRCCGDEHAPPQPGAFHEFAAQLSAMMQH